MKLLILLTVIAAAQADQINQTVLGKMLKLNESEVLTGPSAFLNAGLGIIMVDIEPVYIQRRQARIVTSIDVPCYNNLGIEKYIADWRLALSDTIAWEGRVINEVDFNDTTFKAISSQHSMQRDDLSWRLDQMAGMYTRLSHGSSGLSNIIDYTGGCAQQDQADAPWTSNRPAFANLLSPSADTTSTTTPIQRPTRPLRPRFDINQILADSDDVQRYLTSNNLSSTADLEATHPINACTRAPSVRDNKSFAHCLSVENFNPSYPVKRDVNYTYDDEPPMHTSFGDRVNSLWDELPDEYHISGAILEKLMDLGLRQATETPRQRYVRSFNVDDVVNITQTYTCRVYSSAVGVSQNGKPLWQQSEMTPTTLYPATTSTPASTLKKHQRNVSGSVVPSVTATRYPPIKQLECPVDQYNLTSNDMIDRMALFDAATAAKNAFMSLTTSPETLKNVNTPRVGVYRCFVPKHLPYIPHDVRRMACNWFDLKSDHEIEMDKYSDKRINDDPSVLQGAQAKCSVADDLDGLCYRVQPRNKRGLGYFISDNLWKPLFGSANMRDIKALQKVAGSLKANQIILENTTNVLWGHLQSTSSATAHLANELQKMSESMADWSVRAEERSKNVARLLKNQEVEGYNRDLLMTSASILSYLNTATNNMYETLNHLIAFQASLVNMVYSKTLNPSLFSDNMVRDIAGMLETSLGDTLDLPPAWKDTSIFTQKVGSVTTSGLKIQLVLEVPLISKVKMHNVYRAVTVPMNYGGYRSLHLNGDYVVVQRNPDRYATLSQARYLQCKSSPDDVCPGVVTWHEVASADCLSFVLFPNSLPASRQKARDVCEFVSVGEARAKPTAIEVSNKHWVLYPGKTMCYLEEQCNTGNTVSHTIQNISRLVVMRVKTGCVMTFDNQVMEPLEYSTMHYAPGLVMDDIPSVNMSGYKSIVLQTSDAQRDYVMELTNRYENMLTAGATGFSIKDGTLSTIIQSLESITNSSWTPPDLVKVVVPSGSLNMESISNSIVDYLTSWKVVLIIVAVAAIVITGFWLTRRSSRSHAIAAAAPAVFFSKIPQSYAAAIPMNVSTANSTTWYNITLALDRVLTMEHTYSMPIMMMGMVGVMSVLMVVHQLMTTRSLTKLAYRFISRFRLVALNSLGTHHAGELSVVLSFVMEFVTITGSRSNRVVSVQLCTIPGLVSEWYRKPNPTPWSMVGPVISYRWSGRILLTLEWRHMCLMSRQHPSLETCADMPQVVSLPWTEVRLGTRSDFPSGWIKAVATGITKLSITDGITENIVYLASSSGLTGDHQPLL